MSRKLKAYCIPVRSQSHNLVEARAASWHANQAYFSLFQYPCRRRSAYQSGQARWRIQTGSLLGRLRFNNVQIDGSLYPKPVAVAAARGGREGRRESFVLRMEVNHPLVATSPAAALMSEGVT